MTNCVFTVRNIFNISPYRPGRGLQKYQRTDWLKRRELKSVLLSQGKQTDPSWRQQVCGRASWPDFEALRRFTIVARGLASQLQKTKDTYGGWFLPICKYLKRDCTGCYSDHECQQTAQEEQSTGLDVAMFDFLPDLSLTDTFGCQRPVFILPWLSEERED